MLRGYLQQLFHSYNRTIMELKCVMCNYKFTGSSPYNRTIMELKFYQLTATYLCILLIIEPLWN